MSGQFNFGDVKPSQYFLGIAAVLGLLFFLISPASEDSRSWINMLQWQVQTLGPMLFLIVIHAALLQLGWFQRLGVWLKLVVSGGLATLAFTPIALFSDVVFANESVTRENVVEALWEEWGAMGPPVLLCWLAINAPFILGLKLIRQTELTATRNSSDESSAKKLPANNSRQFDSTKEETSSPIFKMIPTALGNDIIFLKAELHYLSVTTTLGNSLILYNIKDAESELPDDNGFRCHRSYWVAKKHIDSFKRQGRQGIIRLTNGEEVPVSRRYLSELTAKLKPLEC
ncbi:LytTR family transcriptional regulator [Aliikangiella marina]|uniref:LytTR family transcriptional regulator n=1 Tax=Aliikangiella marina TaxID=1712262 RepID=A0A545T7E9_9GAMM|nr:LytTR family DNA-binding domain-containing protein [Aliikangiella marina]TQV73154.1 LytTR family transcriptional regulator [Aliikangiella marina]